MKKILIINGSPRCGQTKRAVDYFTSVLDEGLECEVVNLKDINLSYCKGCAACLSRGEEFCPSKDWLLEIIRKMDEADAIIFASPNYSMNIPAIFKNFFDRTAFIYHRPRFFHKTFYSIVTQGVYGGKNVEKYFKNTAGFWGGKFMTGVVLTLASAAYNPAAEWTKDEKKNADKKLRALAFAVKKELEKNTVHAPNLFRVFMFRITRSSHKYNRKNDRDYNHFKEKGWFESDYFYETKLGPLHKLAGRIGDALIKRSIKNRPASHK